MKRFHIPHRAVWAPECHTLDYWLWSSFFCAELWIIWISSHYSRQEIYSRKNCLVYIVITCGTCGAHEMSGMRTNISISIWRVICSRKFQDTMNSSHLAVDWSDIELNTRRLGNLYNIWKAAEYQVTCKLRHCCTRTHYKRDIILYIL